MKNVWDQDFIDDMVMADQQNHNRTPYHHPMDEDHDSLKRFESPSSSDMATHFTDEMILTQNGMPQHVIEDFLWQQRMRRAEENTCDNPKNCQCERSYESLESTKASVFGMASAASTPRFNYPQGLIREFPAERVPIQANDHKRRSAKVKQEALKVIDDIKEGGDSKVLRSAFDDVILFLQDRNSGRMPRTDRAGPNLRPSSTSSLFKDYKDLIRRAAEASVTGSDPGPLSYQPPKLKYPSRLSEMGKGNLRRIKRARSVFEDEDLTPEPPRLTKHARLSGNAVEPQGSESEAEAEPETASDRISSSRQRLFRSTGRYARRSNLQRSTMRPLKSNQVRRKLHMDQRNPATLLRAKKSDSATNVVHHEPLSCIAQPSRAQFLEESNSDEPPMAKRLRGKKKRQPNSAQAVEDSNSDEPLMAKWLRGKKQRNHDGANASVTPSDGFISPPRKPSAKNSIKRPVMEIGEDDLIPMTNYRRSRAPSAGSLPECYIAGASVTEYQEMDSARRRRSGSRSSDSGSSDSDGAPTPAGSNRDANSVLKGPVTSSFFIDRSFTGRDFDIDNNEITNLDFDVTKHRVCDFKFGLDFNGLSDFDKSL